MRPHCRSLKREGGREGGREGEREMYLCIYVCIIDHCARTHTNTRTRTHACTHTQGPENYQRVHQRQGPRQKTTCLYAGPRNQHNTDSRRRQGLFFSFFFFSFLLESRRQHQPDCRRACVFSSFFPCKSLLSFGKAGWWQKCVFLSPPIFPLFFFFSFFFSFGLPPRQFFLSRKNLKKIGPVWVKLAQRW